MATSMTSKIAISTTLSILMTCTTEIVSPEKRRLCGYTSTIWTRIWLLTSPFVGATSIFGKLGNNNNSSSCAYFANFINNSNYSASNLSLVFEHTWSLIYSINRYSTNNSTDKDTHEKAVKEQQGR
jgi:hypothetical protein